MARGCADRKVGDLMNLRDALARTLLLMRDDVTDLVSDDALITALTETTVTIVADKKNLISHSAQSAYVTLALLLSRSGHQVFLAAPDTHLIGPQPPLGTGDLVEQLLVTGSGLLPGVAFKRGLPKRPVDLAIVLGSTAWKGEPARTLKLFARDWFAKITRASANSTWPDTSWPIGGMAAAALAAPEVFKISMRKLAHWAPNKDLFADLFAPVAGVSLNLALSNATKISDLGSIDFVSGGAITNCALYCLLRLPNLTGSARVIEDDIVALSNLNRCMLFLRSRLGEAKAMELARYATSTFSIEPLTMRYTADTAANIKPLADAVFVEWMTFQRDGKSSAHGQSGWLLERPHILPRWPLIIRPIHRAPVVCIRLMNRPLEKSRPSPSCRFGPAFGKRHIIFVILHQTDFLAGISTSISRH